MTFTLEVECENGVSETEIECKLNLILNQMVRDTPSSEYGLIAGNKVKMGLIHWTEAVAHKDDSPHDQTEIFRSIGK